MRFLEEYTKEHNKKPTDEETIEKLGISESRLKTIKNTVNTANISSIDELISDDMTISDTIKDHNNDIQEIENNIDKDILKTELWKIIESVLTQEEIKLLKLRFIDGLTLEKCGEQIGVSKQRADVKCRSIKSRLVGNYKTRKALMEYM